MAIDTLDLFVLFAKSAITMRKLSDEERREFQAELQCSIGFAGLKPIWRVFI